MANKGKLYLIPVTLGDNDNHGLPKHTLEVIDTLKFFIAERARTSRRFIKAIFPKKNISELIFEELDKHASNINYAQLLNQAIEGNDIGFMSEAGCPGVADPGGEIVAEAHKLKIEVIPLVGPSSILLALMASGMNGQNFAFVGYLSPKPNLLKREFIKYEKISKSNFQTQIAIETPYRNNKFLEIALSTFSPQTKLCIAADITLPTQFIKTKTIAEWKKEKLPNLNKRPTIFLWQG